MDTGEKKNFENAKIILDEIYKNENQKNFNLDNRRSVRVNYYAYYLNKNNLEDAEKFLFDSIQYIKNIEKRGGKEDYYDILDRLYGLNIIQGNFNDALKGLEKLIKDIEKDFGANSPILMGPYSNILRIYTGEYNNLKKAKFYKDKVEVLLKNNPRIKLDRDVIYARVGDYYRKKNEPKKSEPYYEKALKFNNEMAKNYSMILAYNKILLNKFNDAEKLINNFKAPTSYHEIMHLSAKEFLYYEKKDMEEYKKISVDLYQYYSDYSRGIAKGAGNPNTAYYSTNILNFISHIFSLDNKDYFKVSNYFKKQTGMDIKVAVIELFEIIRTSKFNSRVQNVIDRSSNKIVENDKRRLQDLIIEFEKIPKFSKSISKSEENLNKAVKIKNEIFSLREKIKDKLNISSIPEFEKKISMNDLRDKIDNKQVIISYFFDDKDLYMTLISKDNLSFKKVKNINEEIKNLVKNILISLSLNDNKEVNIFDFKSSKKLYDIVIKPFEKDLKFVNEFTIIPHKNLLSIPFEVLISQVPKNKNNYENAKWLGKNYSFSYYPSLYAFNYFNIQKINEVKRSFIGFGNPIFDKEVKKTTNKVDYSNLMVRGIANSDEIRKMSNLPETEEELKLISNNFDKQNTRLFTGKNFTEKNIKSINLKKYKYISFASHAVIANQINNISEPGIIFTPPVVATKEDDGILTSSEIEKLNLESDIVILSACNTASKDGSPNGEGLSGLVSSFFHAGTKSMLVTHWDVETYSAVKLTTDSFENFKNFKKLSHAIRETKISMINNTETAHPFFWAPFVLIGDVRNNL